jgi:hypothetical protein
MRYVFAFFFVLIFASVAVGAEFYILPDCNICFRKGVYENSYVPCDKIPFRQIKIPEENKWTFTLRPMTETEQEIYREIIRKKYGNVCD